LANHTILTTKNIVSSLNNYALKYDDEVDKLDFTVLGLQTYFRTCDIGTFVKFHDDYKKSIQNIRLKFIKRKRKIWNLFIVWN